MNEPAADRASSKRTLVLALALVAAVAGFWAPPALEALGLIETETFYADGTFSRVVGRCVENSCAGTFVCSGQMTEFSRTTFRFCSG